jgi:hypothetical protein
MELNAQAGRLLACSAREAKRVAATVRRKARGRGARIALAQAGGELVPAVAQARALGPAPETERLQFVARHSWSRRFDEVIGIALAE